MAWPAGPGRLTSKALSWSEIDSTVESGDSWNQNGAGGNNDVWGGEGSTGLGDGSFSPTNVSKHAHVEYGGASDGGCRM
jgi:hypothetical protein